MGIFNRKRDQSPPPKPDPETTVVIAGVPVVVATRDREERGNKSRVISVSVPLTQGSTAKNFVLAEFLQSYAEKRINGLIQADYLGRQSSTHGFFYNMGHGYFHGAGKLAPTHENFVAVCRQCADEYQTLDAVLEADEARRKDERAQMDRARTQQADKLKEAARIATAPIFEGVQELFKGWNITLTDEQLAALRERIATAHSAQKGRA